MSYKLSVRHITSIFVFFLCFCSARSQENWTHFRGSSLSGISTSKSLPLKIDDQVIRWKTDIHDNGYSSPVVYNNQIWVTSAKADGKELYAICIDFLTGKIIFDIKVFSPDDIEHKHSINTYASPTPCIEKDFVYVHYGNLGTACINTTNGFVVWKRTDLKCKHVQGPGSSPVLYKNLLILHFDGVDIRYVVALDKTNGKTVWQSNRPEEAFASLPEIGKKAYITPLIIKVKDQDMLISNSSAVCTALNPDNGHEIWRVIDGAESTISMPFAENGIVYWYSGFMMSKEGKKYTDLLAVDPDGSGDISNKNVLWKKYDEQDQNQMLTPLIKNGLIYTINTRNNLMCIDAKTGKEIWSSHLTSNYNSSPVYADGIIWFFSVKGDVLAIKAGQKFEIVYRTKLDSGVWSTPAILRNSMIIRTEKYLCRISQE